MSGLLLRTASDPGVRVVLELMSHSLAEIIYSKSPPDWWNETQKSIVVVGMALGMRYVHGQRRIHRDLKPANVLMDDQHRPFIGDFGSSSFAEATQTGGVGTWRYMAPEEYGEHYEGS